MCTLLGCRGVVIKPRSDKFCYIGVCGQECEIISSTDASRLLTFFCPYNITSIIVSIVLNLLCVGGGRFPITTSGTTFDRRCLSGLTLLIILVKICLVILVCRNKFLRLCRVIS